MGHFCDQKLWIVHFRHLLCRMDSSTPYPIQVFGRMRSLLLIGVFVGFQSGWCWTFGDLLAMALLSGIAAVA